MKRFTVVLSLTVALWSAIGVAGAWAATNAQEVAEDNSLASTLVTPHEAWGKGWAAGPARTLFFVYTGAYAGTWEDTGTRVREVVELQQRFDLPGDAVLFCGKGDNWVFHGLREGEQRAERLLEKPYDLYVVGGFAFERLPAKIQYLILEKVAKGAGLLCCGQPAKDFMVERRQVQPTPTALASGLPELDGKRAADYVSAYRLGKGRGVWLNYRAHGLGPYHGFSWRGLMEYDYWMALIGRAALWAAGKETGVQVSAINGDETATISREAEDNAVEITVSSESDRPATVTVHAALRRAADGRETDLGERQVTLQPGEPSQMRFDVPSLRAGDYFVNVTVRDQRGIEAFGAGTVTVVSEFGVESVEVDRPFVERGQSIVATALLRGTPPEGGALVMRLRDSYDRVVKQQAFPVGAGRDKFALEYTPDDFATIEMRVEAALVLGGEEVEMKQAVFTVPKRRHGQFNFVMWDAPQDVLGYYTWRQLQEAGMGVCLRGAFGKSPQPAALRACDASIAPYSTRILDPKDDQGNMKPVCWNDEPAVTEYVQKIVDNQVNLREQGVFVYSLGDEGVTKGCCAHPACLAAYRGWLQDQYGAIERLNASWGAEYKSFDEVTLLDPKDNMEQQSRKTCFPRWYDREAFARYNLMQFSGRFVEAYRRLDPQSLCGFEGTGRFGEDYDAILGINTFYGPYPSIGDDIIRWAYAPDRVRSNWMGYSKTGDALSDAAWRMVMKNMNSVWYWMWSGIGSWRGYLRPTLDFWPAIEDLKQEMKPVREGLGDLLVQSEMLHSGIAIFYSLPSASSGQLENSASFTSPQAAHTNWLDLTYELGLDLKYLTSGMLKQGALTNQEFRVLLLPMIQALSADEAALIRRFVENGGTVIADVRPGVYDEHCKPMLPGALDDLFGIERTGRGTPVGTEVALKGALDGTGFDVRIPRAKVDADVQADAAKALGTAGDAPIVLVNRVGSGRAVLLNFAATIGRTSDPEGMGAQKLLQALYEVAGVQGVITATAPGGGPLAVSETRVWRNGDALVFGLWRRMENAWFGPKSATIGGTPQPAQVTLAQPRHIYDLRAGKYLGQTGRVSTRLRWGRPSFYLALPYRIEGLDVALPGETSEAGQPFSASITLNVPPDAQEKFAFWVQVLDPQGQSPLWGRQVVVADGGRAQVPLQVAHNDEPGKWRVRVTELFSRASAEATWTVP